MSVNTFKKRVTCTNTKALGNESIKYSQNPIKTKDSKDQYVTPTFKNTYTTNLSYNLENPSNTTQDNDYVNIEKEILLGNIDHCNSIIAELTKLKLIKSFQIKNLEGNLPNEDMKNSLEAQTSREVSSKKTIQIPEEIDEEKKNNTPSKFKRNKPKAKTNNKADSSKSIDKQYKTTVKTSNENTLGNNANCEKLNDVKKEEIDDSEYGVLVKELKRELENIKKQNELEIDNLKEKGQLLKVESIREAKREYETKLNELKRENDEIVQNLKSEIQILESQLSNMISQSEHSKILEDLKAKKNH